MTQDSATNQSTGFRRMRRIATGLLVLDTLVFIGALLYEGTYPSLRWVRIFTEAAMIGGIADWFAVTALFRHPLGVPFPHTAIIPRSKDRIAGELGVFIQRNFLTPEVFKRKLRELNVAGRTAAYLSNEKSVEKLIGGAVIASPHFVKALKDEDLKRFIVKNLLTVSEELKLSPCAGEVVEVLIKSDHEHRLLGTSLQGVERFIDKNRESISRFLRSELPWYIPGFIHHHIVDRGVLRVKEILHDVNADTAHPLRKRYEDAVATLIERLKKDPRYLKQGESLKRQLLKSDVLQEYLSTLAQELQDRFVSATQRPDSFLTDLVRKALLALGKSLQNDHVVQGKINGWIEELVGEFVATRTSYITALISDTVHSWDKKTITDKIELQVGKDLQFIRLNGMIVGGAVGLFINVVVWLAPTLGVAFK